VAVDPGEVWRLTMARTCAWLLSLLSRRCSLLAYCCKSSPLTRNKYLLRRA